MHSLYKVHVHVNLSFCPSARLSVCLSVLCFSILLSICLFVGFTVCLSVCLSICLFVSLSVCLLKGDFRAQISQEFVNFLPTSLRLCVSRIYTRLSTKKNLDWQNSNKNPKIFCYSLNKENNIGHVMQLYLYISNNNRKSLTFVKL